MLEETGVVRTGAKGSHLDIFVSRHLWPGRFVCGDQGRGIFAIPDTYTGLRIDHITSYFIKKWFQGMRSCCSDKPTWVVVGVAIENSLFSQFGLVILYPFRWTQQTGFFTIPGTIDQSAFQFISIFHQSSNGPCFIQFWNDATDGISSSVHPRIVVVAAKDPLIRHFAARKFGNDIVQRFDVPVKLQFQMNIGFPGTHVVGEGQSAAPGGRSNLPAQRLEQRQCILVGNGQDRNFHQRDGFTPVESFGLPGGGYSGCQRITRINGHIHHRTTLYAILWSKSTFRVNVSLGITIVLRVWIDQATHGPVFCCNFWLDAPPGSAVFCYYYFSLYLHTHALQLLIVRWNAVVDKNQTCRYLPIGRIGVVGRQLLFFLPGCFVLFQSRFLQFCFEWLVAKQFQSSCFWGRKKHKIGDYLGLIAPRLKQFGHISGIQLVLRAADVMRPGG